MLSNHGAALCRRLDELPEEIKGAESAVAEQRGLLAELDDDLRLKEARLILSGEVTGSNEQARRAVVIERMASGRYEMRQAELRVAEAEIELRRLRDEFNAARAILRYLGGEEAV